MRESLKSRSFPGSYSAHLAPVTTRNQGNPNLNNRRIGIVVKADVAHRITREIEDVLMESYSGEGILQLFGKSGRMFTELPKAMQWKELNDRVNWTALTAAEKDEVMTRVLKDVR